MIVNAPAKHAGENPVSAVRSVRRRPAPVWTALIAAGIANAPVRTAVMSPAIADAGSVTNCWPSVTAAPIAKN